MFSFLKFCDDDDDDDQYDDDAFYCFVLDSTCRRVTHKISVGPCSIANYVKN